MSHQTGIKGTDELKQSFAAAKDGSVRLLKVVIKDEQLVLDQSAQPCGSWEDDYDNLVLPCVGVKQACYLIYRLDAHDSHGYQWLFISFTSDHAPVRQKMLYAATRATLKMEFGGGNISEELFGTVPEDVNLDGYRKYLKAKHAPAPLTSAEEELKLVKETEIQTSGVDTKHQLVQGLSFPFQRDAMARLQELNEGSHNYVQLCLDLKNEEVHLAKFDNLSPAELAAQIPSDHGRYHFYRYSHTHEGDYQQSIVFIYSMPGGKCPIRERMLYSSCKAPTIQVAEEQIGMQIERKVEVDDPNEVTEAFLYDSVHPQKDIIKQKFSKPKGPAGRGPKRMTRGNQPS